MKNKTLYFALLVCIALVACKKNDKKMAVEKIVTEWMGKTIVFPPDINCSYLGKDTVCPDLAAPYKILIYTDSSGCTSCKLQLSTWKHFIQEADSLMPRKVDFLFYFQPKNEKELAYLVKRDQFEYPVYMDRENKINNSNNFPQEMEFQCFLLNSENKVVSIGNPSLNPKIWDLYKQVITENAGDVKVESLTSVEVEQAEIEINDLKAGKTNTTCFILKNTGHQPLLISHVDASCGCTVPAWEKKPVMPNEKTEIKVEVKPDNAGYFRKTINVYCNIADKTIPLTIYGMTE